MNILIINNHGIGDVVMSLDSINYLLQKKSVNLIILLKSSTEVSFFRSTCLYARFSSRIVLYTNRSVLRLFIFLFRIHHCYSFGSSESKSLLLSISLFCFKIKIASPYKYHTNFFQPYVYKNKLRLHKSILFLNCVAQNIIPFTRYTLTENYFNKTFKNTIVFCVGSGSSELHKRWSYENYVDLVEKIVSLTSLKVFFIGSNTEEELISKIFASLSSKALKLAHNLCNKTCFTDLFSIFSSCKYVIGSDNGMLHIANFCNATILCLFGPTDFNITGPTGTNVHVINRNYSCSPCYLFLGNTNGCGVNACMQDISVNQVLNHMRYKLGLPLHNETGSSMS